MSILKWRTHGHCCQNWLSGDIFEALQILKSSYRNGHICASQQAEPHIVAHMDELDDDLPDLE